MLNVRLVSWALGIWSAVTFVVCVVYGLVTPESPHMHEILEQLLPAFKWFTWGGFLLGLAESFISSRTELNTNIELHRGVLL